MQKLGYAILYERKNNSLVYSSYVNCDIADRRHCHSEAGKGTDRRRAGQCRHCVAIEHDAHLRRIGRSRPRLGCH